MISEFLQTTYQDAEFEKRLETDALREIVDTKCFDNLYEYNYRGNVVNRINNQHREWFNLTDYDKNGKLSREEMNRNYKEDFGRENPEHIENLFVKVDINKNSNIDFEEFVKLVEIFDYNNVDLDKSEIVTRDELKEFYKRTFGKDNDQFVDDFIKLFDKDDNGLLEKGKWGQ